MTPSERDPQLLKHRRSPSSRRRRSAAPRQPSTGRPNLATSRSVNGASCSRTSRTGVAPRRTSIRAPGGRSTVRRPSHHSTPAPSVSASTSTASTDVGATTIGRANSACALIGTISSASTPGQTTGPPAEKLYAVEPVGVAQTTPSQPQRDSGRPSTSTTTSSIRSRAAFSTLASLSANVGRPPRLPR